MQVLSQVGLELLEMPWSPATASEGMVSSLFASVQLSHMLQTFLSGSRPLHFSNASLQSQGTAHLKVDVCWPPLRLSSEPASTPRHPRLDYTMQVT